MSYSYSSYSSFSTTSSSSINGRGTTSGRAYATESHSTPSGTATRTTTQNMGQPTIQETRYYDAHGREMLGDGQGGAPRAAITGAGNNAAAHRHHTPGYVEEIDDDDAAAAAAARAYERRIQDEYAKREGGA